MLSRKIPLKSASRHATPNIRVAAWVPGMNHVKPGTNHVNKVGANVEAMTRAER
jgi:hypothetical protein